MVDQDRTPSSLDTTPLLDHPEVLAKVLHVAHVFPLAVNITNDLKLLADSNASEDARSEARARCYSHPLLRSLAALCQAVVSAVPNDVVRTAAPEAVQDIASASPRKVGLTATQAPAPAVIQKRCTEVGKVGKYRNSKPCSCCKKDRKKVRFAKPQVSTLTEMRVQTVRGYRFGRRL